MVMTRFTFSRKFLLAAGAATLVVGLAAGPSLFDRSAAQAQAPGDVMVPKFEVDPYWPKPMPNNWRLAMVIGLSMDAKDNVWIVHRPQTLEQKESYAARGEADCCTAAPDVLAFDPAGNSGVVMLTNTDMQPEDPRMEMAGFPLLAVLAQLPLDASNGATAGNHTPGQPEGK